MWINICSDFAFVFFFLFFEILEIWTESTGALDGIFFSSVYILAFFAIKDLFFFISKISKIGNFLFNLSFCATDSVINIL